MADMDVFEFAAMIEETPVGPLLASALTDLAG
jgi:hypothetical protein